MNGDLETELRSSREELGLPQTHLSEMSGVIAKGPGGAKLRRHLAKQEKESGTTRITEDSFWTISPKYRFDCLERDILIIADELAMSLAFTHVNLQRLYPCPTTLLYSEILRYTFYHLDFGFRLASSGWDRIALLLDLGFGLNLNYRCKFAEVMKCLPMKHNDLSSNRNFKRLKAFRDKEFRELEDCNFGIRHETTHRLSMLTRYIFEHEENFGKQTPGDIHQLDEWHAQLLQHYHYYIKGIDHSIALLDAISL